MNQVFCIENRHPSKGQGEVYKQVYGQSCQQPEQTSQQFILPLQTPGVRETDYDVSDFLLTFLDTQ